MLQGLQALTCFSFHAATSLTLGVYMGKGYMRSRKPFPQGVFTAVSLVLSTGYASTLL